MPKRYRSGLDADGQARDWLTEDLLRTFEGCGQAVSAAIVKDEFSGADPLNFVGGMVAWAIVASRRSEPVW